MAAASGLRVPGRPRFSVKALLRSPLVRRVLLVVAVVAGLFLALQLGRVWGIIDPRLWDLLSPILAYGAWNTFLFSATIIPISPRPIARRTPARTNGVAEGRITSVHSRRSLDEKARATSSSD